MKTTRTTKEAKKWVKLVIAATMAGISLSGCGTITNAHVRHMSNEQLVLREYQLSRKNNGRWAIGNALGDMQDDQREQETIEREMMKRGIINPLATPQILAPTDKIIYHE